MKKNLSRVLSMVMALMLVISMAAALPTTAKAAEYTAGMGLVASDWSATTGFGADSTVTTAISGDGTYTLTYEGACADLGILVVDIVGAQTDLDAENKTYKVTELTLTIDGKDVPVDLSKVLTGDLETNGNYRIDLYNMYGDSKNDPGLDNTTTVAESLVLTFTIETIEKPAEGTDEPVVAPTGDYVTGLALVASDWSSSTDFHESSSVQTTVTGAGTYTMTYEGACADLGILVVDVVGAGSALSAVGQTFQLDSLTLTIDGAEVAVDMSKVMTGDLEENGNWRIELCNMYGPTAEAPAVDTSKAVAESLVLTYTLSIVNADGTEIPTEPEVVLPEIDLNGEYNVYLLLQTPNWTYRDAWNSDNGIGSDYFGDFIYGNETSEKYGKVVDAVIKGNGTYTVSVTDFGTIFADDFTTAGQDYFNILGLSSDIPLTGDITISDVQLIIDGKVVHKYAEGYQDPDTTDYVKILVQNIWNEDVKEISFYNAPSASLEIQFTVSGFAYDNAEQNADVTEPSTGAPTDGSTDDGNDNGSILPIIIAVVVVAAVAVVVVVVLKKKKAN